MTTTPTTRRRPVVTVVLLAVTALLVLQTAPASGRPTAGVDPTTETRSDIVALACNNSLSPTLFPLQWLVSSTITAPVDAANNARTIYAEDEFTVNFQVTALLAAQFKNGVYGLLGPKAFDLSAARATLAPLGERATPVSPDTNPAAITAGFAPQNVPLPGTPLTVDFTEGSPVVSVTSGTVSSGMVGKLLADVSAPPLATPAAGNLVLAVDTGANTLTMGNAQMAPVNAGETKAATAATVWSPAEVTDTVIPVGAVSKSYVAAPGVNPYDVTFQFLGNASRAATNAAPSGFSLNATNSSLLNGTAVVANTTFAEDPTTPRPITQTQLVADLGGGVSATLHCMGGQWSSEEGPVSPLTGKTGANYIDPLRPPAGASGDPIVAGQGTQALGRLLAYSNAPTLANPYGSPNVLVPLDGIPFTAKDVGTPVKGSVALRQNWADFTGIPDSAVIVAVSSGNAIISAPVTQTSPADEDGFPFDLNDPADQLALAQQFNPSAPPPYEGRGLVDLVGGFATLSVEPIPVPTVTISAISGQTVTNAARAGNTLTFGGPNWAPDQDDEDITVRLCDADGDSNCTTTGLDNLSVATNEAGVLTGTVDLTTGATPGARTLRVDIDSDSDTASLLVLGDPTLTLSSASGPAGGTITVTGTNWDPGTTPDVSALDEGDAVLAGPTQATVGATGNLNGSITTPAGTTSIEVAEGDFVLTASFTINANAQNCGGDGTDDPLTGCTLSQFMYLNVEAGPFTWSQTSPFIVLNSTTTGDACTEADDFQDDCFGLVLNGASQMVTGDLNDVTLVDARGAGAGWTVSVTLTDLTTGGGGTNRTIPANTVILVPSCDIVDGTAWGGTAAVSAGTSTVLGGSPALSATTPITLCSAPAAQAGGTFTAGGSLSFMVPPTIYAGLYTATLTLVAV
jgi:hypothetical protein